MAPLGRDCFVSSVKCFKCFKCFKSGVVLPRLFICLPSLENGAGAPDLGAQEMYAFSSKHVMRVYPGGLRVGSSNYDPTRSWVLGGCGQAAPLAHVH